MEPRSSASNTARSLPPATPVPGSLAVNTSSSWTPIPSLTRAPSGAALAAMRGGAVGGGGMVRFDGWVPLWAWVLYPAYSVTARLIKLVGGAFLFCTREAFEAVGGFPEKFYASEEVHLSAELKKRGRFVVPGPTVVTSARKLRTIPLSEYLRWLRRLLTQGNKAFQQREGLEFWYGPRPTDPL